MNKHNINTFHVVAGPLLNLKTYYAVFLKLVFSMCVFVVPLSVYKYSPMFLLCFWSLVVALKPFCLHILGLFLLHYFFLTVQL